MEAAQSTSVDPLESLRTHDLKTVADLAGMHVVTLRRWIHAGKLRAIRLGKGWRVPHGALLDLLR